MNQVLRFRFTTKTLLVVTLLFAFASCAFVGRQKSLARFSLLTQGLSDRFKASQFPITDKERQLAPGATIPGKNWIVMHGGMEPPRFWGENVRNCEIGTGIAGPVLGCEIYFTVSQPWYAILADPAIEIEYFADERSPNKQLAIWFRDFLKKEYNVDAPIVKLIE